MAFGKNLVTVRLCMAKSSLVYVTASTFSVASQWSLINYEDTYY